MWALSRPTIKDYTAEFAAFVWKEPLCPLKCLVMSTKSRCVTLWFYVSPKITFMHMHPSSHTPFFSRWLFFCFIKLTHIHCLLILRGLSYSKACARMWKRDCVWRSRRMDVRDAHDWPWRGFGSWQSSSAARRWPPCSPRPWLSSARWTPCPSSSACGEDWGQRWWPGSGTSSYFLWPVFIFFGRTQCCSVIYLSTKQEE